MDGAVAEFHEESEVDERLRFETLLADVSASFLHAPAEELDDKVLDALRRFCQFLDLDRSTLWQSTAARPGLYFLTHLHQPMDAPAAPPSPELHQYFPWVAEQMDQGKHLTIGRMSEVPPEATRDLQTWTVYRTKAVLVFPMVNDNGVIGVLSLAGMREEREWGPEVTVRCRVFAQILAGALARKHSDLALRESELRSRILFESAPVGLVWIGKDGRAKGANPEQARLFGFRSPEELIGFATPLLVAERDRERFRSDLIGCLSGAEVPSRTYNLVRCDGTEFIGEVTSEPLKTPSGEVDGYLCATRDVTALVQATENWRSAVAELNRLKEQLHHENVYLRHEVRSLQGAMPIVGSSVALQKALSQAQQVAATDSTILLLGETGTGKELLAKYVHRIGRRSAKAFVATNIAAIPGTLLECELFGREKGAYTGAVSKQVGRFEMADGGTLFLDEIGELPLETQTKLLRVLQEGEFERLGNNRTIRVNVQIIAATNRNLLDMVREGRFRQDLYYRLNVFPITVPPLRDRAEDIPLLVASFVREFSDRMGKRIERVRRKDMDALQRHDWPGNVRELRNLIERSMILATGPVLELAPLPGNPEGTAGASQTLRDIERVHIEKVLQTTRGRIRGPSGAAEILGIKPPTLYALMERLGIKREHTQNRPHADTGVDGLTRE